MTNNITYKETTSLLADHVRTFFPDSGYIIILARRIAQLQGDTFDTALPVNWVNAVRELGINTNQYIWLYKGKSFNGKPMHVLQYIRMYIVEVNNDIPLIAESIHFMQKEFESYSRYFETELV
jgi:hypothetical protein